MPGIIGVPSAGALSYTLSGTPHGSIWGGGLAFYTAVAGDSISLIEFFGNTVIPGPTIKVILCVYTVVAGLPANQVHTPIDIFPLSNVPQWWQVTGLSIPLTAGVTYCICGVIAGRRITVRYFVSGYGSSGVGFSFTLPNPWTHTGFLSRVLSIRAIVSGSVVSGNQDHRRGVRPTS